MIRVRLILQFPALEEGVRALLRAEAAIDVLEDESMAADVQIMTSAAFARAVDHAAGEDAALGPVLLLGAEGRDLQILRRQGTAWGVLPMDVESEELCAAVRAVAAGLLVGTPQLLASRGESGQERGSLTEREAQVLSLLSTGLANKQMAAQLGISEHTIKFHVSSLYNKLNVGNRAEAVREGLRRGLIAL